MKHSQQKHSNNQTTHTVQKRISIRKASKKEIMHKHCRRRSKFLGFHPIDKPILQNNSKATARYNQ
jgi:hypothetical protein